MHTDIRDLPKFSEDTLFAVKAPYGSTLEVPEPESSGTAGGRDIASPYQHHHELQLSSKNGPIDVYLIQDHGSLKQTTSSELLDCVDGTIAPAPLKLNQGAYLELAQPEVDLAIGGTGDDIQTGQYFDYSEILNVFNLPVDANQLSQEHQQ